MNVIVATVGALIAYLITSYIAATMALHFSGTKLYILMTLLLCVGVALALVWIWMKTKFQFRKEAAAAASGAIGGGGDAGGGGGEGGEADLLVRDAQARLAASQVAQGATIGNLPVFLLVGDQGATKTSVMLHSGLEPELLAGQVFQDNTVVPTRALNLWFARQAVFAEAGGKLLADSGQWVRLIKHLKPGALKSVVGKGAQAPRAALLCFNAEVLLQPNAQELITLAARSLNARLADIAQNLGINFPVYVLFTKTDRLPFFPEFVRNLSPDEATQVLGTTLPMRPAKGTGIYSEEETQRLSHFFNLMFYALSDKRLEFLPREHDPSQLPGAYEFPREFRKLRSLVVQFLVDVGRPSQLSNSAFLRGFYFSGVRPVTVNETAPIPKSSQPARQAFEPAGSATQIFRMGAAAAEPAPAFQPQQVTGQKKVPQWVFLGHLFNDVLLQDRAAMGASAASTKTSATRRVLFGVLAGICLFFTLMFLTSFLKNRALLNEAKTAASKIAASEGQGGQAPSADAVQNLDTLLGSLKTLTSYKYDEGVPFMMRWGLYTGEDAYPAVRALYYDKLRQVMFGDTREAMRAYCDKLPMQPGPNDEFSPSYNILKGYLITTSHFDKRSKQFLTPLMLERWAAAHPNAPQMKDAFRKHLDFYNEDPNGANPLPQPEDGHAVTTARTYLNNFSGFQRVYGGLLAEVERKVQPVNYNAKFPGTNEVIINNRDVRGPFTKDGYAAMLDAIKNVDKKYVAEKWVLELSDKDLNFGKMKDDLLNLYQANYIKEWKQYLQNTNYVKYQNLPDAAAKLSKLVGAQTPILALLGLCSQNTGIDNQKVKDAFRSVQYTVAPASANGGVFQTDANRGYMDSLSALQNAVKDASDGASPSGPPDQKAQLTRAKAQETRNIVVAVSRNFGVDTDGIGVLTQHILEEPITQTEGLVRDMGPAELNKKGGGLCSEVSRVFGKYPFNPKTNADATLAEVYSLFHQGDGTIWKFYDENLKASVDKQGTHYDRKAGAPMSINPAFIDFLNQSSAFAEAMYPNGAATPKLSYTLKALSNDQITAYTLNMEGKTANFTPSSGPQQYVFTGTANGMNLKGKMGSGDTPMATQPGIWASFRFFNDADTFPANNPHDLTWKVRTGKAETILYTYQFQLDLGSLPPIFQNGYFSHIRCTPNVALAGK